MKIQKTWLTTYVKHRKATIEVSLNYETKTFNISEPHQDENITFKDEIEDCEDKIRCVATALKFIKSELQK